MSNTWINEYLERYRKALFETDLQGELIAFKELCEDLRNSGGKLLLAGNGASASIASHGATDFTKQGKVRSVCFNESNLITAFANDYGYEYWVSEAVKAYGDAGDVAVMISSSGSSANIVNGAKTAMEMGMKVVTFSGFGPENPLKAIGDINFWVESRAYNIIENTHQIWLTTVVDMLVGNAEYSVS